MFGKVIFLFVALFATQALMGTYPVTHLTGKYPHVPGKYLHLPKMLGLCVTEIWLDERNVDYIKSDIFGVGFSIAKWWFDTLEECYVIVPDGSMYEAYPNNNLPSHIEFMGSPQPLTSCGVSMRGVGVEYSGTYELLSLVRHSADNSRTLTRQKNNLTIRIVDLFRTSDLKL